MKDFIKVTGMVLLAAPVGDYDKRLVLLTRERGRITAFARGARRQNSSLLAGTRPFSFGDFYLYEGRDSYSVRSIEITNYFEGLSSDMEAACYGFYFLEVADYLGHENMDESQLLKLLYQSLRALLAASIPNRLVRLVYEMKAMVINGEYSDTPPFAVDESTSYTLQYIIWAPVEKLYTFTVKDQVLEELDRCVGEFKRRYLPKEFRALETLKLMVGKVY